MMLLLSQCCDDGDARGWLWLWGNNDYDKICWQQLVGKTFCKSFWGLLVSVLVVSWWSLNCVSVVVVGALVILWWCVRNVLTVFGDVLGCSCLGGVSVVCWRCSGCVLVALKEWHLFD